MGLRLIRESICDSRNHASTVLLRNQSRQQSRSSDALVVSPFLGSSRQPAVVAFGAFCTESIPQRCFGMLLPEGGSRMPGIK